MESPRFFHVMISIDGSANSKDCFDVRVSQVVIKSLLKSNYRINVLHIFNVTKEYLAFNMKPDYLHQQYEAELVSLLVPSRFSLTWLPFNPRSSTRDQIMTLAEGYHADLLVVGFVGRKGPKADPTILGSAVDLNLRKGKCAMMVMKTKTQRRDTPENSYLWAALVDGSERSLKAVVYAASLMTPTLDKLKVLHFTKGSPAPESLRSDLEASLATTGVSWELVVTDSGDSEIESSLLDYVNKGPDQIDFIVVSGIVGGS